MLENLKKYDHFASMSAMLRQMRGIGFSELERGEFKFLSELLNHREGEQLDDIGKSFLWQEAVQFIPAAGGLAREFIIDDTMNGKARLAYLRGKYHWLTHNLTTFITKDDKTGKYLEIFREYKPENGGWQLISSREISSSEFRYAYPNGLKNTPTWCNSLVSAIGTDSYGIPSLQNYNNKNGWTANQIHSRIIKGSYNTR